MELELFSPRVFDFRFDRYSFGAAFSLVMAVLSVHPARGAGNWPQCADLFTRPTVLSTRSGAQLDPALLDDLARLYSDAFQDENDRWRDFRLYHFELKLREVLLDTKIDEQDLRNRIRERLRTIPSDTTAAKEIRSEIVRQTNALQGPPVRLELSFQTEVPLSGKVVFSDHHAQPLSLFRGGSMWSADGSLLALRPDLTVDKQGVCQIVNVRTGVRVAEFDGSGSFSKDGSTWIQYKDPVARVINLATGATLFRGKVRGQPIPERSEKEFLISESLRSDGAKTIFLHRFNSVDQKPISMFMAAAYSRQLNQMLYFDMKRELRLMDIASGQQLPLPMHLQGARPSKVIDSLVANVLPLQIDGKPHLLTVDGLRLISASEGTLVSVFSDHVFVFRTKTWSKVLVFNDRLNEMRTFDGKLVSGGREPRRIAINQGQTGTLLLDLATFDERHLPVQYERWEQPGWLGRSVSGSAGLANEFLNVDFGAEIFSGESGQVTPFPAATAHLDILSTPNQKGTWLMSPRTNLPRMWVGDSQYGAAFSPSGDMLATYNDGRLMIYRIHLEASAD